MSLRDILYLGGFGLVGAVGIYLTAAPRRLFMRSDDPARYRPEAVDHDSAQGAWLHKVQGPAMIAVAIIFLFFHFT